MRRALKWAPADRRARDERTPMSVYGSNPDDVPAMAWMRRMSRSDSDVDMHPESTPEMDSSAASSSTTSTSAPNSEATTARRVSGQGASTPDHSPESACKSPHAIKVVATNKVSYGGAVHMAPNYIVQVGETSSTERFEKCNSCDDLVKVFNGSTKSWDMLRGKDVVSWERVSEP